MADEAPPKVRGKRAAAKPTQAEADKIARDAEAEACFLSVNAEKRKWFKMLDDFTNTRLPAAGTRAESGQDDTSRDVHSLVQSAQNKALIAAFKAIELFCDDLRPPAPFKLEEPLFDPSRFGKDQ